METLEAATAVRVLPPACLGADAGAPAIEGTIERTRSERALAVTEILDADALDQFVSTWGFEEPAELRTRVERLATSGEHFLGLVYAGSIAGGWTRTLRIVDDGPAIAPLFLTQSSVGGLPITVFVIGEGTARLGDAPSLAVAADRVRWQGGTSDYRAARDQLLADAPRGWFLETAQPAWRKASGAFDDLPVVASSYLERAWAYGDAKGDCPRDVSSFVGSEKAVGRACARGALANVLADGGGGCVEEAAADEIDPSSMRCTEGADDWALACSGLAPSRTWLTRAATRVVAGGYGEDVPIEIGDGRERSPFMLAENRCEADAGSDAAGRGAGSVMMSDASGTAGSTPDTAATGGIPLGTGGSGYGAAPPGLRAGTGSTEPVSGGYVEVHGGGACSGSTEPAPEPDDDSDSCSRSDPPNDDAPDDGCDGSDSSNEQADGCDGSSEQDSSSSDSCDSSSSGSSGTAGGDCAMSRRRRRKTRTSLVTLSILALIAPLRRLTRPRRAG